MHQILAFLVMHMPYLWDGARFRITDSMATTHNAGDSLLVVASDSLVLRFVSDRAQLLLDLRPRAELAERPSGRERGDWWSVDLVRRLLTGERQVTVLLGEDHAVFLREHLDEIEAAFGSERWDETRRGLVAVRQQRSDEMWRTR